MLGKLSRTGILNGAQYQERWFVNPSKLKNRCIGAYVFKRMAYPSSVMLVPVRSMLTLKRRDAWGLRANEYFSVPNNAACKLLSAKGQVLFPAISCLVSHLEFRLGVGKPPVGASQKNALLGFKSTMTQAHLLRFSQNISKSSSRDYLV